MTRRILALAGVCCITVVLLTHVAERWHIFPGMGWGLPNSLGHYLDLMSAILGFGFLFVALLWRKESD